MVRTQAQKVTLYSLSSAMASEETIHDLHSPPKGTPAAADVLKIIEQMPALVWTTDLDLNVTRVHGNGLGHLMQASQHSSGMAISDFFENNDPAFRSWRPTGTPWEAILRPWNVD